MSTVSPRLGLLRPEGPDLVAVASQISDNYTTLDNLWAPASPAAVSIAGTTSSGSTLTVARSDHVHPGPGYGAPVAVGAANAEGTASSLSRSDHVHASSGIWLNHIESFDLEPAVSEDVVIYVPSAPVTGWLILRGRSPRAGLLAAHDHGGAAASGTESALHGHTITVTSTDLGSKNSGAENIGHTHTFTSGTESGLHSHTLTTGGASAGHSHSGTSDAGSGHSHTLPAGAGALVIQVNTAQAQTISTSTEASHSHTFSTGSVSADHSHSGTSATESALHSHSGTTGDISVGHLHTTTIGSHTHAASSATESALHTHTTTIASAGAGGYLAAIRPSAVTVLIDGVSRTVLLGGPFGSSGGDWDSGSLDIAGLLTAGAFNTITVQSTTGGRLKVHTVLRV